MSRSIQFDKNLQCKKKKKKPKKEIVRKNNKYKPLNYDKRLHYDFIPNQVKEYVFCGLMSSRRTT